MENFLFSDSYWNILSFFARINLILFLFLLAYKICLFLMHLIYELIDSKTDMK